VNGRHIKLTYLLTAPEPAQGRSSGEAVVTGILGVGERKRIINIF